MTRDPFHVSRCIIPTSTGGERRLNPIRTHTRWVAERESTGGGDRRTGDQTGPTTSVCGHPAIMAQGGEGRARDRTVGPPSLMSPPNPSIDFAQSFATGPPCPPQEEVQSSATGPLCPLEEVVQSSGTGPLCPPEEEVADISSSMNVSSLRKEGEDKAVGHHLARTKAPVRQMGMSIATRTSFIEVLCLHPGEVSSHPIVRLESQADQYPSSSRIFRGSCQPHRVNFVAVALLIHANKIPDSQEWTLDSQEWTLDSQEWTLDSQEWNFDSQERTLDSQE